MTTATVARNPKPSTATLREKPGWISARRARPIGVSGESATATRTATAAPPTAMTAARDERHRDEVTPVCAQRGECCVVVGVGRDLSNQRLAEDQQRGQADDGAEQRQSDRFEMDRPLRLVRRRLDVGAKVDLTVAGRDDAPHRPLERGKICQPVPETNPEALHGGYGFQGHALVTRRTGAGRPG